MAEGTLKRDSTTGKLLKTVDGRLKRCDGCCDCSQVIRAYPCFQVLDEECERQIPEYVFVCTNAVCDEGGGPIGVEEPVTFIAGGTCYRTRPGTEQPFSELSEIQQIAAIEGPLECLPSCGEEVCGDPQDVCPCVCHENATEDLDGNPLADPLATYCCLGKKDADGELCWDWVYEGYEEKSAEWASYHGGFPVGACSAERNCNASASCTWYRKEIRSKPEDSIDICGRACCLSKQLEARTTLDKRAVGVDLCAPTAFPGCCDCADLATNTWADEGSPIEVCTPTNRGERTTVLTLFDDGDLEGCPRKAIRTIYEKYTCDERIVTVTDETWSADGNGEDQCICSLKQTEVYHSRYTFNRPAADDVECGQCLSALLAEEE